MRQICGHLGGAGPQGAWFGTGNGMRGYMCGAAGLALGLLSGGAAMAQVMAGDTRVSKELVYQTLGLTLPGEIDCFVPEGAEPAYPLNCNLAGVNATIGRLSIEGLELWQLLGGIPGADWNRFSAVPIVDAFHWKVNVDEFTRWEVDYRRTLCVVGAPVSGEERQRIAARAECIVGAMSDAEALWVTYEFPVEGAPQPDQAYHLSPGAMRQLKISAEFWTDKLWLWF